ncbi:MAG: glycosyltransferase family 2 protein [Desulfuromonadaceae bacterium]|nr:glycosyltransferase family 2 protein [Desulfuromonadaceae bacterium]MDD2848972.1 glycosyltransferase family 2 protein [Desulfuromonadaceae bacterium]MDD4130321.1 glycosyltransferase family 2 protein [Desulfuromonadaceae bacterium]
MYEYIIGFIAVILLCYVALSVTYSMFLTIIYFVYKDNHSYKKINLKKIAIIIPAHNEEFIVDGLCKNLKKINYSKELYDVYFIADNCCDRTASICSDNDFKVIERYDETNKGKGYAIKYAFDNVPLDKYDAFLIIDADTYVDENILFELSKSLSNGDTAIQCYIKIPNKDETWFTKILCVSRVINGLFYHYPKSMLGLSSYLMGSGICFSTDLIKKKGWTAFSIAEDWEYYAQLLLAGYRIAFAKNAVVYQYESRSIVQATSQRLRWSSGRWKVTKTLGIQLLIEGIKKRSLILFDASLPLIFPNNSLQINLTFLALALVFVLPSSVFKIFFVAATLVLLAGQFLIFILGAFVAGSLWKTLCVALCVPVFLVWKLIIDILCFSGLYRGTKWVRTSRHQS